MQIIPLADIAGDGATHVVAANPARAKWVQFAVTGSGTVRIGGANTLATAASVTLGLPVAANAGQLLPVNGSDISDTYPLAELTAYVPIGATLSILYGI